MTAIPQDTVLELENINKFFGGVHAVRDMTFTIKKGELAGLIGPNGAGKTTIFNLITGVYSPDNGYINFFGEDITNLKSFEVIRKGIARTFQNLRLFQRSSALENVMVAMQQHHKYSFLEGISHFGKWSRVEREIKQRSMDILDRVGLVERAHQAAGTLPYGMQRRLEIGRALALEPEFLLLDEPAAGMNPEEVFELNDLIQEIHEDFKLTILVIEHHMDVIMQICPHIICMNFGARIAEGNPDHIQGHPEVLKAYLGEEVEE